MSRPPRPGHGAALAVTPGLQRAAALRPPRRPQPGLHPRATWTTCAARPARRRSRTPPERYGAARGGSGSGSTPAAPSPTWSPSTRTPASWPPSRRPRPRPTRPRGSWTGIAKVLAVLGVGAEAVTAGLPRHHRGHQPAAGGQGRPARLRHHRGLRAPAGDRPPERPRRLRQQLLLGQAAPDRPRRPGQDRRRPPRPHRRRAAPLRLGRGPRGRAVPARPGGGRRRGLLPARLRQPGPRAAHARDPGRGAPGGRRLAVQRGAARVPRVRAGHDHPGRRRRQAAGRPRTWPPSPGASRSCPARRRPRRCRSTS